MFRRWVTFFLKCFQLFCLKILVCICLSLSVSFFEINLNFALKLILKFSGPEDAKTKDFIQIASDYFVPGLISILVDVENPESVTRKSVSQFKMIRNSATAYCCHNKRCTLPITDPKLLAEEFASNYLLVDDAKKN
jgi:uncharacterized protein YyaL (SSP411 family)